MLNDSCCKPLNLGVTCSTGIDTNGEGMLEPVTMYANHDICENTWHFCFLVRLLLNKQEAPWERLRLLHQLCLSSQAALICAHGPPSETGHGFSVAATNNTDVLSSRSIGWRSDTGLNRLKSRYQRARSFLWGLFLGLFRLLEAARTPWLVASSSINVTVSKGELNCSHIISVWPPPLPPPTSQDLYDYIDPTW